PGNIDVANSSDPPTVRSREHPAKTGRIGEMNANRTAVRPRGARPLRPGELAQSSVMAALCAATAIVAIVVPFAGALALLGTVPMGLLAYRYRIRVFIAATVA